MIRCLLPGLLLCVAHIASAQIHKPIAARVLHDAPGRTIDLFTMMDDAGTAYSGVVDKASVVEVEMGRLRTLLSARPHAIMIALPYDDRSITVRLQRVELFTGTPLVRTDKGSVAGYEPGAYYRGIINDDPSSVAAFSFFNDKVIGMASSAEFGDLVIARLRGDDAAGRHIIYSDRELLVGGSLSCSTAASSTTRDPHEPQTVAVERTQHCVRLCYDLSHSMFEETGSDEVQSMDWITAVHNNVAALFENDGITVSLSDVFIWTGPEPFEQFPSTGYMLDSYFLYRTAFNGDIANYITTGDGSGQAMGIGTLCTSETYQVSMVPAAYAEVPVFSVPVHVIAHEIGHVCGSPHTHACTWNGNDTQIDDCGNIDPPFGVAEGAACFDELVPILPAQGTIMSYCETMDLSLGFGAQPAQRMIDHIEAATCLGGDCLNSCTHSVDSIRITNITPTEALLTFYDHNPLATQWQIQVLFIADGPWWPVLDWTTITSTSFLIENLGPFGGYLVRIISDCPPPWSNGVMYYAPFETPYMQCYGEVKDNGWNGPYDGTDMHECFFPEEPGQAVTLTFEVFDLQPGGDFLTLYDGPDTEAPVIGTWTGNTLPGPFTSTHPSGALTLVFDCDSIDMTNAYQGWDVNISCELPTGLDDAATEEVVFSCQPVPMTDAITVNYSLSDAGRVRLELLDMQGRMVHVLADAERGAGPRRETFQLPPITAGSYMLLMRQDELVRVLRVVK